MLFISCIGDKSNETTILILDVIKKRDSKYLTIHETLLLLGTIAESE